MEKSFGYVGKRINIYIGIDALASINCWSAVNGIIDRNRFLVNTAYYSFALGLQFYLDEFFKVIYRLRRIRTFRSEFNEEMKVE
tara:strand:- start:218 stop:469 length:252 start_codon:yes stop_codon:yes gene_type:complete